MAGSAFSTFDDGGGALSGRQVSRRRSVTRHLPLALGHGSTLPNVLRCSSVISVGLLAACPLG